MENICSKTEKEVKLILRRLRELWGWSDDKKNTDTKIELLEKGASIDCDASVLLLRDGKLKHKHKDVICFYHLKHKTGAVQHMGDNVTGAGRGDDEQILVNRDNGEEICKYNLSENYDGKTAMVFV
ncbi:MAG: TerD family protein [Lachnospiraceae bacterium]